MADEDRPDPLSPLRFGLQACVEVVVEGGAVHDGVGRGLGVEVFDDNLVNKEGVVVRMLCL